MMFFNRFLAVIVLLAGSLAAADLQAPRIGVVRQPDGTLRPLLGMRANFVYGDALPVPRVLAAAFSDQAGLTFSAGEITLWDASGVLGRFQTAESHPLLAVPGAAASALVWLPDSSTLLHWNGAGFDAFPLDLSHMPGAIVSGLRLNVVALTGPPAVVSPRLRQTVNTLPTHRQAELLLTTTGGAVERAVFSLDTGALLRAFVLPGITGHVFPAGSELLYQDIHGLEARATDGTVQTFNIPENDLVFESAATDWVRISSPATGRQWMLHIDGNSLDLSMLPPAPAATEAAQ